MREVPDLSNLIDRIVKKHERQGRKTKNNYKVPSELQFLAQHFQQHYCNKANMDKVQCAFIPSLRPIGTDEPNDEKIESDVILSSPNKTFTG